MIVWLCGFNLHNFTWAGVHNKVLAIMMVPYFGPQERRSYMAKYELFNQNLFDPLLKTANFSTYANVVYLVHLVNLNCVVNN